MMGGEGGEDKGDPNNITIIDQSKSAFGGGGLGATLGPGLSQGLASILGAAFGLPPP